MNPNLNASLDEIMILATDKKPCAEDIVKAVVAKGVILFRDQLGDPYIAINGDGSDVTKIGSKKSKLWLANYVYSLSGQVISPAMVLQVLQTLAGKAVFEGPQYKLDVRIAYGDRTVWYDLGTSVVRITENGWEVKEQPPIQFKRYSHSEKQVLPKTGGDIRSLLKYINVHNESEQLLFLVYVIAAFISGFPHPLLILHGSHGAGKSTPMQIMKMLIDPSSMKRGTSNTKDMNQLVQTFSHHAFIFIDNLSAVPDWLSDALARAATGDSFSKRELYTDDDDVIYYIQKVIALNGINQIVQKPDLLDRSILLNLERVSPKMRKEEVELFAEFEQERPLILGAIFDILTKAIALYPDVKLDKLPRMADFARWGYAIAEAAGLKGTDFVKAYDGNIATQDDEAIAASPLAQAVIAFMENQDKWSGQPAEVYRLLSAIAIELELHDSNSWPKDAVRLSKALPLIQPNLLAKGIDVERSRGKQRLIIFTKLTVTTDNTDVSTSKT